MMRVGAKKYRLMIVLDNVDRLSDEEALSLWSTMRSFFVDRLGQDFSVTHAPVVIVPVDIGSLTRVFVKNPEAGKHAKEVAQSYIDKTFDVVFDVREPAISDWRPFFDETFEKAVGDEYKSWDIHQARRIYEGYAVRGGRKTTPRSVIRLANAVGAIVSTSPGIPLATILLYVLYKSEIEDGISAWVSNKERDYSEFDTEWKLNLAALHFMTDRTKAVGPLLKDDVVSAILAEAPEKIEDYGDIRGLGDVIAEIAHDPPVDEDGVLKIGALATIVSILKEYGATIHGSPLWLQEAQSSLAKSFLKLDTAQRDLSKLRSTIEYLAGFDDNKAGLARTAAAIIHLRLSAQRVDSAGLDAIADALDGLQQLATDNHLGTLEIPIAGNATLTLTRQYAIYRRSKSWRCIKGPSDHNEIDTVLAKRLDDPVAQSSVPDMIRMLSFNDEQRLVLSSEVEDSPLLTSINAIIEDGAKLQFLASAADAMTELQLDSPELASVVEGWSDDGRLSARFTEAVNEGDARRVWALIILGLASGKFFAVPAQHTWPDPFKKRDIVARSLSLLAKRPASERIDLIWRAIREWESVRDLLYVLRNELIGSLSSEDLDSTALLRDYENTIIQAGRAPFLNFLIRNRDTDDVLAELAPDALVQMIELPNISADARVKILAALRQRMHAASVDDWVVWIQDGNGLFLHWNEVKKGSTVQFGKRSKLAIALQRTSAVAVTNRAVLKRWLQSLEVGTSSMVHDAKVALLREIAESTNTSNAIAVLKIVDGIEAAVQEQGSGWSDLLARIITHEDGRAWVDAHAASVKKRVKAFNATDGKKLKTAIDTLAKDKREGRRLWAQKTKAVWFK
jgi:hypothetical protein